MAESLILRVDGYAVRQLVEFDRVKLKPATKEGKSLGVEDEKKKEEEA